jgi:predicted nucleic acid-binding protein
VTGAAAPAGVSPSFVLDASVTAAWLLPDERTPAAERAYAQLRASVAEVHAPELWLWECGNIIANAVKRKRMATADAQPLWNVLDGVRSRVDLVAFEPSQTRACLALAVDESLSIYDAAYLWLAMSLALPLMTHDERLAAAARHQDVAVWRVENLS